MAEEAWTYSMGIVGGAECRRNVWLCKVLFFTEQMWLEAAWEEAQRFVSATGRVGGPAVEDVRSLVEQKQAVSVDDGNRWKLAELERLLLSNSCN